MGRLDGRIALVTGASRGFGAAVALRFVEEGAATVAVAEVAEELAVLAERAPAARPGSTGTGRLIPRHVDLGDREAVDALADRIIAELGRLDVLVNAAAILRNRRLRDLTWEAFETTVRVNFLAAAQLCRRLLPAFDAAGGGSIVNVSSRAGIQGFDGETDYCASKFALEGFSYSLAQELRDSNVAVNLVTPGLRIKPTSVTLAEFASWPAERRAQYHDPVVMTDAFVYLALQRGDGVTGQRFDAFKLSERIRREGWDLTPSTGATG